MKKPLEEVLKNATPIPALEDIERRGDQLVASGFETEVDAEESNAFEARVMGIPQRECPVCGAEVGRYQKRCGDCDSSLN